MKKIILPLLVLATLTTVSMASSDNVQDSSEAIRNAIKQGNFKSLNILRYAYQDSNPLLSKRGKIVVAVDGVVDQSQKGTCHIVQNLADGKIINFEPSIKIELLDDATDRLGFEQDAVNEFYIGSSNAMQGLGVSQRALTSNQIVYKNTYDELSVRATCGSFGHVSVSPQHIVNTMSIEVKQVNMFAEFECGGVFGVGAKKHVKVTSCQF